MSIRIVVIGGVAAGASAAAKARRTNEQAQITILEKGKYISYANCGLPYYVGGVIQKRNALLLHTPESLGRRYAADIHVETEARAIDPEKKIIIAETPEGEKTFEYDKLVLATGSKTIVPPIKGIDRVKYFAMRTVLDVDAIKEYIENKRPQSAVIIGAGYIGIEVAEALYHCNIETTIVEAETTILPLFPKEMTLGINRNLKKAGITVMTGAFVTEVEQNGSIALKLKDGSTLSTDMLFLCTGVKPDTSLAETAGIRLGDQGGVVTNDRMKTYVEDIYAAGDLVEKVNMITGKNILLPLAGPANREGRVAGCNAAGGDMTFKGVLGTSIVGFNETCIAQTGLSLEGALEAGFDADSVFTEDAHRATYYPDPRYIYMRLVYDKKSGRLLGASASGSLGVERRIDVLSTALYAGLTVYDLEHMELCYAPPYGSAKDNVNMAGFVASNQMRGTGFGVRPDEFVALYRAKDSYQLLDVRTKLENKAYSLDGAKHIHVDDLRAQLDKLDIKKPIYVYCAVGFRAYLATLILRSNGFEAYNIMGGIESVRRFLKV